MSGQTITADSVQKCITRGHAVIDGSCPREELAALADELGNHIDALLPVARTAADKLWRGGPDWIRLTGQLDRIRDQSRTGLGHGVLTAYVSIRMLTVDCEWLLLHYGDSLPAPGATR